MTDPSPGHGILPHSSKKVRKNSVKILKGCIPGQYVYCIYGCYVQILFKQT